MQWGDHLLTRLTERAEENATAKLEPSVLDKIMRWEQIGTNKNQNYVCKVHKEEAHWSSLHAALFFWWPDLKVEKGKGSQRVAEAFVIMWLKEVAPKWRGEWPRSWGRRKICSNLKWRWGESAAYSLKRLHSSRGGKKWIQRYGRGRCMHTRSRCGPLAAPLITKSGRSHCQARWAQSRR